MQASVCCAAIAHVGTNLETNLQSASAPGGETTPEPVYEQLTSSAADRQQAAADRVSVSNCDDIEAAAYVKSLRDDGIDPCLISTMEKESEVDAMTECETYSVQLGKSEPTMLQLEVWAVVA